MFDVIQHSRRLNYKSFVLNWDWHLFYLFILRLPRWNGFLLNLGKKQIIKAIFSCEESYSEQSCHNSFICLLSVYSGCNNLRLKEKSDSESDVC